MILTISVRVEGWWFLWKLGGYFVLAILWTSQAVKPSKENKVQSKGQNNNNQYNTAKQRKKCFQQRIYHLHSNAIMSNYRACSKKVEFHSYFFIIILYTFYWLCVFSCCSKWLWTPWVIQSSVWMCVTWIQHSKIYPMATVFRTECFRSEKIPQRFGEICSCITVTYRLHRHSGVNKRIFCFCVLRGRLEIIYTAHIMSTHTQCCIRDVHLSLTMHHSGLA